MKNGIDVKRLILWALYDFGNSFAFIIFFLYYSQWLVVDRGVSDFWFNMTFVGSSLLFLLTVPVAAALADKRGTRMPWLRWTTLLAALSYFLTAVIATAYPSQYVLSIVTFSLATYFYLFAFAFYHPLLREVATPERQGFASGWGQFGNWFGQMSGLLIALPFAAGTFTILGEAGRAQTLIPATFLFLVFAAPMIFTFKEKSQRVPVPVNVRTEYRNVFKSFLNLCAVPGIGLFFLAYFFFNDAIATSSNNFPIFIENVFSVPDDVKSLLLVGILATSAIGAPISGWIADRIGFKRTLQWILGGFVVVFPLLAIAPTFTFFATVAVIMGLWFGAIWTTTRAYLLRLTPPSMTNLSFTYYELMERLATLVGPISWGLIVTYLPRAGALNYRTAAAAMALFVIIGLYFIKKLPDTKKIGGEPSLISTSPP